jgi:hypothetical protein
MLIKCPGEFLEYSRYFGFWLFHRVIEKCGIAKEF